MRALLLDPVRSGRLFPAVVAFLLAVSMLGGGPLAAQDRPVLSSAISVSGGDASLEITFEDESRLEIELRNGVVFIDGDRVGTYERDGALDRSWRSLLGRAVALSDGPLAETLFAWTPPDEGPVEPGRSIDRALETALSAPSRSSGAEEGGNLNTVSGDLDMALLSSLLDRTDRYLALAEAMDDLDLDFRDLDGADGIRVHVGETVTIPEDETLASTLILIDSDLRIRGHLDGSAVLLGGSVEVGEDARVDGEIHLADARVVREGGVVTGGINRLRPDREVVDEERFDELRDEIREEIRREIRASVPASRSRRDSDGFFDAFRYVGRGIGGMMQNLFTFAFLALLGFAVVRFYGGNLEVVAEAARANPTRAGVVGVAGAFLLLPVWILGIVGLCISLIGIPVLLAWIPLFPVAALLAAGLGFLAVASNIGDWVARQNLQGFDWVRRSNALSVVLAGVAALILPFFAANFIQMAGPWLGFVRGILTFVGTVAVLVTLAVGFGAVLLTRGGRRREWPAPGPFDVDEADVWDREFRSGTATDEHPGTEDATESPEHPTTEAGDPEAEADRDDSGATP